MEFLKKTINIFVTVILFFGILVLLIVNPVLVFRKNKAVEVDAARMRNDAEYLTSIKPARDSVNPESLTKISDYISKEFRKLNCELKIQNFAVNEKEYRNVSCIFGSEKAETIVVGAHYDVMGNQQGADDNASGVAGMLETARAINNSKASIKNQIEFVAYSLEEPPFFGTEQMGSAVHAKSVADGNRKVKLMISLEMIGYYDGKKNSQTYPAPWLKWIYPAKGDFIAVVGLFGDYLSTRKIKKSFKQSAKIDTWSINAPNFFPGIDFSDHRNYWENGINAVMITDTSFYRNKNYHEKSDTIDTLDFDKMGEVVKGLYAFLVE